MIKILEIKPIEDYKLLITFETNEKKVFNIKPYLNKGVFEELKDQSYFKLVKNNYYFIEWPNYQDLSSDTLYYESENVA